MSEPDENPESEGEAEWDCIVPFLNQDRTYAYGVEFGMLYAEVRESEEIKGYYSRANQDQILLLLSRLGWTVGEMKEHDEHWFWLEARR